MTQDSIIKEMGNNTNSILKFVFCIPCLIFGVAFGGLPTWIFVIFYPQPTIYTLNVWLGLLLVSVVITAFWLAIVGVPILKRTTVKYIIAMVDEE